MATAPNGVEVHGVELDPLTARLAKRLHEQYGHRITEGGIELARPDGTFGTFAAAIGNVPFAEVRPYDPWSNPNRELSLHNLAIRQAIRSVQPGAPVVLITSSFTLDATSPQQRELLAAEAQFLGAVRLPASAFATQSGTEVTTDVVVFQRLREGEQSTGFADWGNVTQLTVVDGVPIVGSSWWADHPDMVVGSFDVGGLYSATSSKVSLDPSTDFAEAFSDAMGTLSEAIAERRLGPFPISAGASGLSSHQPAGQTPDPGRPDRPEWIKPGGIYGSRAEGFWQHPASGFGGDQPYVVKPKKDAGVLEELIRLRDSYMRLVEAEAGDSPAIEQLRSELNIAYDRATRSGPLSQFSVSVRTDGAEVHRRPPFGGFRRNDPDFASLTGLEVFDADTQIAEKAAIFTSRQLQPAEPVSAVDSPLEAVALSLHSHGQIDPGQVAQLLGVSVDDVAQAMEGTAFQDPATDGWVDRATYLSGNVRAKLEAATAAGLDSNVAALREVVPQDLGIDEISVQLGVPWITASEVTQFVDELFDHPEGWSPSVAYHPLGGWSFDPGRAKGASGEAYVSTWGTDRVHAMELVAAGLRNEPIKVYDKVDRVDGGTKSVLNHEATISAQQKLGEINAAFNDWLGSEPDRAALIEARYNQLFRSHVQPVYDGDWPRPPGLAADLSLRPHQSAAVKRLIMTGTVGLYHAVGAGKTYTMATAAMEMRRLGIANKPLLVVPNHLLTQFAAEFQRAYPASNLLVPDGRGPEDRRRFVGQAAAGDWDCIIVPEPMFQAIPVKTETELAYIESRVNEMRDAVAAMEGTADTRQVKRIEKRIASMEAKLGELIARPRDPSLAWERLGVDAVLADEFHAYKNLEVVTARSDLTVKASQRAIDMDLKLMVLRDSPGPSPIMAATGTPLTNSFHEKWVMMRFTDPDLLAELGVDRFDAFIAQFGQVTADFELGPSGWKLKERLAKFTNVPELQAIFAQTADVKRREDLGLPIPDLEGGRAQPVIIPRSPQLESFMNELKGRAEHMPSDPKVDNHLKVLGDFRKASVSLQLVGAHDPIDNKITRLADLIAERWEREAGNVYLDSHGDPHPVTGSLQIVFLDHGVPGSKVDLYEQLRTELATRGVEPDRVAFVHEARDPKALYAQAREGRVNVLVGSTQKMGTGMNAQNRATALYHVDPPWRPADIEQRNGRILRQGNQNRSVSIYHLIQEGSGDALAYQGLERKAVMINGVLSNTNTDRTIENVDADEINFGDLKALASGDPRVIELLRSKRTLGELEISWRSHLRAVQRAHRLIPQLTEQIPRYAARINDLRQLISAIPNPPEIHPAIPIPDGTVNDALHQALPVLNRTSEIIGTVAAGIEITAHRSQGGVEFDVAGHRLLFVDATELKQANLATRLRNGLTRLEVRRRNLVDQHSSAERSLAQAKANQHKAFPKQVELDTARSQVSKLEEELSGKTSEPDPTANGLDGPGSQIRPDATRLSQQPGPSTTPKPGRRPTPPPTIDRHPKP